MQQRHSAPPGHPAAYPKQGANGKAVVAIVLTLIGVVLLPFVFSTAGVFLAIVARKEIARYPGQRGKGLATAAIVIGALGFVLGLALALLVEV